jgi:hypothetical protein
MAIPVTMAVEAPMAATVMATSVVDEDVKGPLGQDGVARLKENFGASGVLGMWRT